MSGTRETENRKLDHIKLTVNRDVEFDDKTTLFEEIELPHSSTPDMDLEEVDTSTSFLGKDLSAPIFVTAITGGHESSEKINKDIAKAVGELGLGMGLGSQRAMLEDPSLAYTYDVKSEHDPAFLLGNIGLAQLKKYDIGQLEQVIGEVNADALAVHSNPAQEAVQPEGDTDFKGCLNQLKKLSEQLDYPVILKQVGEGISEKSASSLNDFGLYAVDVGGAGGSSWTKIDNLRSEHSYGDTFKEWGIPTAQSLVETKRNYNGRVTATGGIRTGLDVAKAVALGAEACGVGLPVLKAQQRGGPEEIKKLFSTIVKELRIAMFLTGSKDIDQLKELKVKTPF